MSYEYQRLLKHLKCQTVNHKESVYLFLVIAGNRSHSNVLEAFRILFLRLVKPLFFTNSQELRDTPTVHQWTRTL